MMREDMRGMIMVRCHNGAAAVARLDGDRVWRVGVKTSRRRVSVRSVSASDANDPDQQSHLPYTKSESVV